MRNVGRVAALALVLALHSTAGAQHELVPRWGQAIDARQIEALSITIYPDGQGLPPGAGRAIEGAALYAQRCAMCHGPSGIEGPAARLAGSDGFFSWRDPLRVLRIRRHPLLVLSVGAQWPYATSVFDYVRRAMPHHAPKSLSADEVYALTAHLLHLNGLVRDDEWLDRHRLPRVIMPGLARSLSAWPAPAAPPTSAAR